MKPRDLAIVAAVIAIAGFAAADALRSGGVGDPSEPATTRGGDGQEYGGTGTAAEREQFAPVPAGGAVVFTDQSDECRLREVSVGTGIEFPHPRIETTCQIWAAPTGDRLAYGLPVAALEGNPEVTPFAFVDLTHTNRELGAFEALFGSVVWSPDGQRSGWCDADRRGFDYEVGRDLVRVAQCPRGYTADGRVAYLEEGSIVADGEAVLTAAGSIDHFSFAQDGSLAVLVDALRLERWEKGRRTRALRLPAPVQGHRPTFSPDHCRALFSARANVYVVSLGCPAGAKPIWAVPGSAAAWSPDGRWIAVADLDEIVIYGAEGGAPVGRWPVTAHSLAWR